MKKVMGIMLAVVLLAATFGCAAPAAEKPATEAPATEAAAPAAEEAKKIKLGIDYHAELRFDLDIVSTLEAGCKERGWDYIVMCNNLDGAKAIEDAEALITAGCNLIFSYNTDEGVTTTIQEICDEAGVDVVFVGLQYDGVTMVSGDHYGGSKYGMEKTLERVNEKWDGAIDLVLVAEFPETGNVNTDCVNGGLDYLKAQRPDITDDMIVRFDGKFDILTCQELATNALMSHPDAEHIIVTATYAGWQAQGVFNAAEDLGRLDDIMIHTIHVADETPGYMVAYPEIWVGTADLMGNDYGNSCLELFDRFVAGEDVERICFYAPFVWMDSTNIGDYYEVILPEKMD